MSAETIPLTYGQGEQGQTNPEQIQLETWRRALTDTNRFLCLIEFPEGTDFVAILAPEPHCPEKGALTIYYQKQLELIRQGIKTAKKGSSFRLKVLIALANQEGRNFSAWLGTKPGQEFQSYKTQTGTGKIFITEGQSSLVSYRHLSFDPEGPPRSPLRSAEIGELIAGALNIATAVTNQTGWKVTPLDAGAFIQEQEEKLRQGQVKIYLAYSSGWP